MFMDNHTHVRVVNMINLSKSFPTSSTMNRVTVYLLCTLRLTGSSLTTNGRIPVLNDTLLNLRTLIRVPLLSESE